jgi:hypothetical protein
VNEIVDAMASAWGEWHNSRDFPFVPDSGYCINGTRTVIGALRALGVAARPVSVEMLLCNEMAWGLIADKVPNEEWPEAAHSIGIGMGVDELREGRWDGHLITEGDGWTMDVSAQTSRRPGRIEIEGPFVFPRNLPDEGTAAFRSPRGVMIVARRTPQNNGWRQAPGWKRLHAAEQEELVRRTRRWIGRREMSADDPAG